MREVDESKGFVKGFNWGLYPECEKLLLNEMKNFLRNNKFARNFSKKLARETSTEMYDWIDHMIIPTSRLNEKTLRALGYSQDSYCATREGVKVFRHRGTVFFPILLDPAERYELSIKVDDIEDCIAANGKRSDIAGGELSPIRKAAINISGRFVFSAIERRGSHDFIVPDATSDEKAYSKAIDAFESRKRLFNSDSQGMDNTKNLIRSTLKNLSPARTADAFFRGERKYWMKRNRAGQIQYARQNTLGLGFGNHDHHTYRSSRANFSNLIHVFELMGYKCRERFYAGEKAGWGAQILEHPTCDLVIFADVDITHDEKDHDFAHVGLKESDHMGTVGLWVGLHGESILQAGMHHLEARFDFKRLRKDLKRKGVEMMKPFSDFSFLKQAFTIGERWKVEEKRLRKLLDSKLITIEQYHGFIARGAIGSHMENLQRRQGFKGFNQNSVSAIIKATNPLKRLLTLDDSSHKRGA